MKNIQVTFVDVEDKEEAKCITMPLGASLLDAALGLGVDMEATCGARGSCRSCRVKILAGDVPPPTVQDRVQLGSEEVREQFRLACQTKLIDDCRVMAASEKSEAGHQILGDNGNLSDDNRLALDSGVEKYLINAKTPAEKDNQSSDYDEILAELPIGVGQYVDLEVVRKVPTRLREKDGQLTVTAFNDRIIDIEAGDSREHAYGVAIDVGTTSVVGTLLNLQTGEKLAEKGGINPQTTFGGDLMSRIAYSLYDDKKFAKLRVRLLNALNSLIKDTCESAGIDAKHVYKIVVVGNTCMHHFVLGINVTYLGLSPYAASFRRPFTTVATELPFKAVPNARVCFLPVIAGFVGADTLACILATRIYESTEVRALVDIGTNGEVVMGSKDQLVACSAPAGPAFEGAEISHGMRGAVGAIERAKLVDGDFEFAVIGNVPAIGICGSGLIDICSELIAAGVMDLTGRLCKKDVGGLPKSLQKRLRVTDEGTEVILVTSAASGKNEPVTLTQRDIRELQLAKGAIYAAIVMLQKVMGIPDDELAEVMLCGGFGNYMNTQNAVKIRLLPMQPNDRITYAGNAALVGAQMAVLSETERHRATEIAKRVDHVALATHPDFQDIFLEGIEFPPAEAFSDSSDSVLAGD